MPKGPGVIRNILDYIKIFILPSGCGHRWPDSVLIAGGIEGAGVRRDGVVEGEIDGRLHFFVLVQKLLIAWPSNHRMDYRI